MTTANPADAIPAYFYAVARERGFTGDDYAAAATIINHDRLIQAARHVAAIEGHARCLTSQWHELADAVGRVAECADLAAALAGNRERAGAVARRALDYARYLRIMERCEARGNRAAARRWQDKAVIECDAMITLLQ